MTGFAGHVRMLSLQRIFGLIVIESNGLPGILRMAICAQFSNPAFMFIVFLVTAIAGRRGLPEFRLRLVAGLALDLLCIGMGAFEREVRPFMIEALIIDGSDILSPALMFRVALLAFPLFLEAPVKPLLLIDIFADIFVAIKAEGCLRRFVEPLMACGAGVFPLGMPLDHLARHQGDFDGVRPG
jgi:hypothetical protein